MTFKNKIQTKNNGNNAESIMKFQDPYEKRDYYDVIGHVEELNKANHLLPCPKKMQDIQGLVLLKRVMRSMRGFSHICKIN